MPQRPDENAPAKRSTEGSKPGAVARGKGPQTAARRRGRPPGSRNKTKSLIPTELAGQLLDLMKDRLPGEHYEYMKGVVLRGESIATDKELDALITLVRGSLMPYLAMEALPMPVTDADGEPVLDEETGEAKTAFPGINRDVTDRLKLLNSMLTLKDGIERRKAGEEDPDAQPLIIKLAGARGLLADGGRLALLVGGPGGVAGDADGTGRAALPPRTVSDSVPERQEPVENREQVEADWVLDDSGG